jgi:hypothetical protein
MRQMILALKYSRNKLKIKGQLYCIGVELKRNGFWICFTKQFCSQSVGICFMNHIYNGVIENENIPALFGGIVFENESKIVMNGCIKKIKLTIS